MRKYLLFLFYFFSTSVFALSYDECLSEVQRYKGLPNCLSPNSCTFAVEQISLSSFKFRMDRTYPSGGTSSYICISGTDACPAGYSRLTPLSFCTPSAPPPPTCTAGSHKSLYVVAGQFPNGAPPTLYLKKNWDGSESVGTMGNRVMFGGCVYTIPDSPSLGCQTTSTGVVGCKVTATATGESFQGAPDEALDGDIGIANSPSSCLPPLSWEGDHCAPPSASPGCYTSVGSTGPVEVCPENPQKNCGTVNGAQLCVTSNGMTSNGYPAAIIDGQVVGETQNVNGQTNRCVTTDTGKVVCINLPVADGLTGSCGPGAGLCVSLKTAGDYHPKINDPLKAGPTSISVPISDDPQQVSKTVTTTSATGSRQEVITTTTDIVGSTPTIVTNNYGSDGSLTSSNTQVGNMNGTGTGTGTGTSTKDGTFAGSAGGYSGQGRFYTASDKTIDSVGDDFMATASNSPILNIGRDVFNVTFPQMSSCAECDFSIPSVMGMNAIEVYPFCASWMPSFWSFIAAALKVATVLMAVRIMITPTA